MGFVREFHGMRMNADNILENLTPIDIASLMLKGPTRSDNIQGLIMSECEYSGVGVSAGQGAAFVRGTHRALWIVEVSFWEKLKKRIVERIW